MSRLETNAEGAERCSTRTCGNMSGSCQSGNVSQVTWDMRTDEKRLVLNMVGGRKEGCECCFASPFGQLSATSEKCLG